MKLKLSLQDPTGGGVTHDVLVTVDTTVTVGALADAIGASRPTWATPLHGASPTLRLGGRDSRVLPRLATVAEAGIRSGQTLAWAPESQLSAGQESEAAALLTVLEGPDAGRRFPLREGANQLGRDQGNDVRLSDPLVSKQHARINVGEVLEIIDLGSANGVEVGEAAVDRAALRTEDRVRLGDTVVQVTRAQDRTGARLSGATVAFNRSPLLRPRYRGEELPAPDVPGPPERLKLPLIPLVAPVLMGCVLFAVTRQLVSVLFLALSPMMMVGTLVENRRSSERQHREALAQFRAELVQLGTRLSQAAIEEVAVRCQEQPAVADLLDAAARRGPQLWSMRPDREGYLELRLGLGRLPSRTLVALPPAHGGAATLQAELAATIEPFRLVNDVPVVVRFGSPPRESGAPARRPSPGSPGGSAEGAATPEPIGQEGHLALGVAGPRSVALGIARGLVAQLVSLHSPADLVLAAVASSAVAADWDWLKWLPHVNSEHSPLHTEHLAASPGTALQLVTAMEEELERRAGSEGGSEPRSPTPPTVVVLVEDDAPIDRSRLVELGERGPTLGVHLVWVAPSVERLPAVCSVFVAHEAGAEPATVAGDVTTGRSVRLAPEVLAPADAADLARALAPLVDAGARVDDESDLPQRVSLLTLIGADTAEADGAAVLDRWQTSGSLPVSDGQMARRRKPGQLRGLVGVAAGRNLVLDLREHGPHALVGGTTGSGKSEFLQSWIMAMATEHSPHRVTFLFVDYKGGAAFGECVRLPHAVGLVTDLSPHLVDRALTSLNAELRHRETILRRKRAKDLADLEARGDPDAPPSLVIVVDEFAALVAEVPQFVDGVVNVAQRGRSLGLHLVLATQRPAGVIRDNLRANTNLRIALRMADNEDSTDVVGSPVAGGFDPGLPGRAVAKLGPGRLTPFQAGYVGGWTPDEPPPPPIVVEDLAFGGGANWAGDEPPPPAEETGPNDLHRLVTAIARAHQLAGLPLPRRPWLDPLAPVYDLTRSPQSRTDRELIFGICDEPDQQRQGSVAFFPDRDGNMAVFGTGGSGKSTVLRTLGVVAGLSSRGGPCHVYGLDFAGRGLQILEDLDHVGAIVPGDDEERVVRLLRTLRQTIDERATRYAGVSAATVEEYRQRAGQTDEPRLLLLMDGVGAFRQAYEVGPLARWWDTFVAIAAEGRPVGVHVVLSADRSGAIPSALASVIQRRLVLRLASEEEYPFLGVPADALDATSPPGRGYLEDREVQVAVLGGTTNTATQAAAIRSLAGQLRRSSPRLAAPPVGRLPELVPLVDLPAETDGLPVLGLADDTLAPIGFRPDGFFFVVGPPRSGRTSVLAAAATALHRWRPDLPLVHLCMAPSPLAGLLPWSARATGADEVAVLVKDLCAELEALPAAGPAGPPVAVVVEDLLGFAGTPVEAALQDLFKVAGAHSASVLTDAETSAAGSWGALSQPVKAARHGIALQPDQLDGDNLFKTSFPRLARRDFPPGRGMYVSAGRAVKVQVALAEGGDA